MLIVEQLSGGHGNVVPGQGSASSGTDDAVTIRVRAQKSGLKRSAEPRRGGDGGGQGGRETQSRCSTLTFILALSKTMEFSPSEEL